MQGIVSRDIYATEAAETLASPSNYVGPWTYYFESGTSVTARLDTILNWSPGDRIDLSGLGLTLEDLQVRLVGDGTIAKLISGFGAEDFQLKVSLRGHDVEDILESLRFDPIEYSNTIIATSDAELLRGTQDADTFRIDEGMSTAGALDTIQGWQAGDQIDLSGLGLSKADLQVRLVGDGNILKLIAGFGADDFQLKIGLNGANMMEVLDSIIYGETVPEPAPQTAEDPIEGYLLAEMATQQKSSVSEVSSGAPDDGLQPVWGYLLDMDGFDFG